MIPDTKLIAFLSKVDSNLQLLKHNGREFITPPDLYKKGIKVCDLCGAFMPLEKQTCRCGNDVYVMQELSAKERKQLDKIIVATSSIKTQYYCIKGTSRVTNERVRLSDVLTIDEANEWMETNKSKYANVYMNINKVKI